jgi:ATP-dependent RNA helicase RhlE
VLEGRDLLGCAQTGTGKTAAFALPILHRLGNAGRQDGSPGRRIRCLVLSPTRELAAQIADSFRVYGRYTGLRHTVVYGGVGQGPQVRALKDGVDILVATPGRLLDLMSQGFVDLRAVAVFVLDEGDRMLDMGFIPDIRKVIAKLPTNRQTLLFSATIPYDIRKLADTMLRQPVSVHITPDTVAVETVEQSVYLVETRDKPDLLAHFLGNQAITRALVFTRTKHGADRVVRRLRADAIRADAIHGNKAQAARQRALAKFKSGETRVLVATDIAARGLDIDEVSHVVNYDVPNIPETYVHRIGRTGRAGASGIAVSFCGFEERAHLKAIERLIRKAILVNEDFPGYSTPPRRQPQHPPEPRPAERRPTTAKSFCSAERTGQGYGHDQESRRRNFWTGRSSRHATRVTRAR